jgi:hypothetical protein
MKKFVVTVGALVALVSVAVSFWGDFNHIFRSGVEIDGAPGYSLKDSSRRAIFRNDSKTAIVPPHVYQFKVLDGILIVARKGGGPRIGEDGKLIDETRECQKLGIDIQTGRFVDLSESLSVRVNCE